MDRLLRASPGACLALSRGLEVQDRAAKRIDTPPGGFQGEALALSHFTLIVAVEDDLECTAQPQYAAAGLAVYAHPLALLRQ